jgi:hypothetical protein
VAAVQYTFTHKQYTECREWNIQITKRKKEKNRAMPLLGELCCGICVTSEEKTLKSLC